jgi:hypothetical protein
MKSILFSIALLASSFLLNAQPGDAEIRQMAVKNGAIETRFTSEKGTVHTNLTEKWYMRTMESKWKTNNAGIYRWERTEYRYDFVGGKWVFKRTYLNSSWFDGVPNPSESEIMAIINADVEKYIGSYRMIGKPESIKMADNPKWEWHDLKSVSFNTVCIYTEKVNEIGDAVRKKEIRRVRLYRQTDDTKAPFTSFNASAEGQFEKLEDVKYEIEVEESPFQRIAREREEAQKEEEKTPEYPSYSINDAVTVDWNKKGTQFYNGKIIKLDPHDKNRYFIEFETIQSAWIHADWIKKR